jgi:hypothetical protein
MTAHLRHRGPISRASARLWSADAGLSLLLALVVFQVFILMPLQALGFAGFWATTVFDVIGAAIIVSGVLALSRRRWAALLVTPMIGAAVLLRVAQLRFPDTRVWELETILRLGAIVLLVVLMLVQVFRPGPVTKQRIQGAVAVYLLLVLAWAQAYLLVLLLNPGALEGVSAEGGDTSAKLVYFSLGALTSVGLVDVSPTAPVTQSLAGMEALLGQLFPAILLARLVSLEMVSEEPGS